MLILYVYTHQNEASKRTVYGATKNAEREMTDHHNQAVRHENDRHENAGLQNAGMLDTKIDGMKIAYLL